MSASRQEEERGYISSVLNRLPLSLRFLFADDGPFKVDLREDFKSSAREQFRRVRDAAYDELVAGSAAMALTQEAEKPVGVRSAADWLRILKEGGLECKITNENLIIKIMSSALALNLLVQSDAKESVHRELLRQFKAWSENPSQDDPITKKVIELTRQQSQVRADQKDNHILSGDIKEPLVQILFRAFGRDGSIMIPSSVPFMLIKGDVSGATTKEECIKLFNDKVDRYLKGELESISVAETIAPGWRLFSQYYKEEERKGTVLLPLSDVFFKKILPDFKKLHNKLEELNKLEDKSRELERSRDELEKARGDKLAEQWWSSTEIDSFKYRIDDEIAYAITSGLPAMIRGESVSLPLSVIIGVVAKRIESFKEANQRQEKELKEAMGRSSMPKK